MTQVQALTGARAVSSGKKRFTLTLMDPLGQETLAVYDSITNPGPIVGGFVSHRYPNGTCGTLNFEARPDRMPSGIPRAICKLVYDTGTEVVPDHYGVLTINPDPNRKNRGQYQSVGGKELLKNSPIPDTFDINYGQDVDAAIWLQHFAGRYRHKALNYDANLIPLTGQMFAGSMYDAAGSNLYDVFKAIVSGCPNLSDDDWGVDAEGYIVVRPATGTVTLQYSEISREFLTGDIYSEDTCTSARLKLINRVSEGGIVSAGYRPHPVIFTYTDPSHMAYEAPRDFKVPTKTDGTPILELLTKATTGATLGGWEFLPAGTSASTAFNDDSLATYGRPNGSNTSVYAEVASIPATPPVAVDVVAELADGTYSALVTFAYSFASDNSKELKVTFDLSPYKGKGAVYTRLVSPPPLRYGNNTLRYISVRLDITGSSALQSFVKLYEFKLLVPNVALLTQIAKSNIKLPAREVTEITCARRIVRDERGDVKEAVRPFLLSSYGKYVAVEGVPLPDGKTTTVTSEIKEIVNTYSTKEDMLSRIGAGGKIRSPEVMAINNAINRRMEAG